MPTISVENYLKAIYHLESETGEAVKTKDLAAALALTLPSATSMLRSLAQDGYVAYQPYRGARLTDAGRRNALRIIRNHRLVEALLVEVLGYTWDEVHVEAERLEHAVSDQLADRIDAYLAHPEFDPHGDPIPRADGTVRRRSTGSLLHATPGVAVEISRITDQSPDALRYLQDLGLIPGAPVVVIEVQPFDGPVVVRHQDARTVLVSQRLAGHIRIADPTATPA